MKHLHDCTAWILPFAMLTLVGCNGCNSGSPTPVNPVGLKGEKTKKEPNPFEIAARTFRYPENPRISDDWTRFRDGLPSLNVHFGKSEVVEQVRLSPAERKFLEMQLRLTPDEIIEVASLSLRSADAHYLDECFLLRDVEKSLDINGMSDLDRVDHLFRWVMRNIYLHEQGDSWTPPAFTLRRGHGSAIERALVFLALLRQANQEACLIVVPATEPMQFLIGVPIVPPAGQKEKTTKVHLFDPHLGLPVRGADGNSIATLKDVQANPKLLAPSLIAADDVKKLEAWLVCPLQALAPRMLATEIGFRAIDPIVMHLDAMRLAKHIKETTELETKAWNEAADGPKLPNSPTRALRMFLPKLEGGIDESGRARADFANRLPFETIQLQYARIDAQPPFMPPAAYGALMAISQDLLVKFSVQTRELQLRGLHDAAIRRHDRLQTFARQDLARLIDDKEFRDELSAWQKQMRKAVDVPPDDPRAVAKGQKIAMAFIYQDQFVGWLLDMETEKQLAREQKKSVVTGILAIGLGDYFDGVLGREQGTRNHEKAVRAQAKLAAMATPTKRSKELAEEGWSLASSAWSNFYLDQIALEHTITQRLEQIRTRVLPNDVVRRISLLEHLHREIHHYFEAKLRLAECIEHLEGPAKARAYLEKVQAEFAELEKKDLFAEQFKSARAPLDAGTFPAQPRDYWRRRLDLLAGDWGPRGGFFWMKQHIRQRIGA